jgi:hypothetical protein
MEEDEELKDILQKLTVFSNIKENEKLMTKNGIGVNKPTDYLVWLKRTYFGETRENGLYSIELTFQNAFKKMFQAIEEKEKLVSDPDLNQAKVAAKIRVDNKILRIQQGIRKAKERVFPKLTTTYQEDTSIISKIEILSNDIDDKLKEVEASLDYLKRKIASSSTNPWTNHPSELSPALQ